MFRDFFCLKSPIEIVGPAWAMHFKLNLITVKAELIKKRWHPDPKQCRKVKEMSNVPHIRH